MASYEQERIYTLRQLNILDTPPSESYDRITRMASRLFNLPIAAVSLTDHDRQWFKSRVGVDHWQIPREAAPCGNVSDSREFLVIPDLLASPCYRDSLLAASGVRFYAGAPLVTRDGYVLGAMCVLGTEPRQLAETEQELLTDLAAMVMAQIELQHALGRVDPLSRLPNRSQFVEDITDLARDREGEERTAIFIDLVDPQKLTELMRVMGPAYLEELAAGAGRRLREALAPDLRLYHVGPCQYLYLVDAAPLETLHGTAVQIQQRVRTATGDDATALLVKPSIGIAPLVIGEVSAADILRMAHSASQDGRLAASGVGYFSEALDASHQRRFSLLADLRNQLHEPRDLRLVYQPRVRLADGRCVGAEALIRWRHPALGDISPAEFVPLAEHGGFARALTSWVAEAALQQAALWRAAGMDLRISINISALNLEEADFASRLLASMTRQDVPGAAIELELVESALIDEGTTARHQLALLREAGVTLAIDDFGTGYSTLAYLQALPVQVIKIDRSFIKDVESNPRAEKLTRGLIHMSQDLGYSVVAEGIEDASCYALLKALGCDEAQGYFIARPLEVADFQVWWRDRPALPG